MSDRIYISVILPLKLEWEPLYYTTSKNIKKGNRVRVSFAGKEYSGVVSGIDVLKTDTAHALMAGNTISDKVQDDAGTLYMNLSDSEEADNCKQVIAGNETREEEIPEIGRLKIKEITAIESQLEDIGDKEIELWRKMSEYYLCTVGEIYKAAYPVSKISLEENEARKEESARIRIRKKAAAIEQKISRLKERISGEHAKLNMIECSTSSGTNKSALKKAAACRDRISGLEEKISALEDSLNMLCSNGSSIVALEQVNNDISADDVLQEKVTLTSEQIKAYEGIEDAFERNKTVLLHGVTGSGKTELYMSLACKAMGGGQSVLYMVPEIALSRQLESRLKKIFKDRVLVFHSAESLPSKRKVSSLLRSGDPYIVLGTRSAIFLPFSNLGLVIVDEEHDTSYKQDSPAPRYNGRDCAVFLGIIHRCNVILGSATPSLESIYNCMGNKYRYIHLGERYHKSDKPEIEIIDTIAERRKNGMKGSFSKKLIERIRDTLDEGRQVMLLRARRSYSPVMQCTECGEIMKCPHCNVAMSYHKDKESMICHYCGHSQPYTGLCIKCGSVMAGLGTGGTQKIEEEAGILFPTAVIARLDSDTAQKKNYETEIIEKFAEGKIDILIGTQILTKGFDFRGLGLVAVLQADSLLGMEDFRADEKAIQILEQFGGRCGRRNEKGRFIIQTSRPDHPVYGKLLENKDEDITASFGMLAERKEFGYPPFTRIINVIFKDKSEKRIEFMSEMLAKEFSTIQDNGNPEVTGPFSPSVSRVSDYEIRIIRLCLAKDRNLGIMKRKLLETIRKFEKRRTYSGHISIDVDPH